MQTTTKIKSLDNASSQEKLLIHKAIVLQQEIINTLNFRMKFESTKFKQNDGLSSLQIYNKVMSGFSNLTKYEDFCLDYSIEVFLGKKGTLAATNMNTFKIFLNKLSFQHWLNNKNGVAYCAGSLFHEYLHTMGFTHSYLPLGTKRKSVPYLGGAIMRDLIKFKLGGGVLTPLKN